MGEFTAEAWITPGQPTTTPIESGYLIYFIGQNEGVGLHYSGNVLWCRAAEADATHQDSGNVSIPVGTDGESSGIHFDYNKWVHVAFTVKADAVNLWVAGQFSQTLTRTKSTPMNIRILQLFRSLNGPGTFTVAGCRFWDSEKYTANFTPDTGLLNP